MIKQILFPVDFSSSCIAMAAYVKRAATIFGAEVTLIHVCDLNSHNGFELYARPLVDIAEEHWNLAQGKLALFLKSEFPAAECPRILSTGDPASVITETAKTNKYDLIVMPTHAGRFRQMLLGSTTAKVLNDAVCPVLTTQHAVEIAPRSREHLKWACAIGLSYDSERILRYAKNAALAAGAELSVIHAVQDGRVDSESQTPSGEEQQARQRLAELQSRVGSDAPVCITRGSVKDALLDAAREKSADLLVLGRSSHGSGAGRMRELTYSLIRDSPCPVVSV